eukprot:2396060-Rhodomonas_salina.4
MPGTDVGSMVLGGARTWDAPLDGSTCATGKALGPVFEAPYPTGVCCYHTPVLSRAYAVLSPSTTKRREIFTDSTLRCEKCPVRHPDALSSALHLRPPSLNPQPSTLNPQPSTLNADVLCHTRPGQRRKRGGASRVRSGASPRTRAASPAPSASSCVAAAPPDARCSMLDARCSMLDAQFLSRKGCLMLDVCPVFDATRRLGLRLAVSNAGLREPDRHVHVLHLPSLLSQVDPAPC